MLFFGHYTLITEAGDLCTVEPLLKDTQNKGHNTFNLFVKYKFCGPYNTKQYNFTTLKSIIVKSHQNLLIPKCPLFRGFTGFNICLV